MPRQKLRDWPQNTYKFRAYFPTGKVPEVVWQRAKAMRTLWNDCVAAYDIFTASLPEGMSKEQQNEKFQALMGGPGKILYDLVAARGPELGLGCWQYWHIYETFVNALKASWKGIRRRPKMHFGLSKVFIPHRTSSGGVELDWLWRHIQPVADETIAIQSRENRRARHSQGSIPIGGAKLDMSVVLYTLIPKGTIVKRLAVSGEHIRPFDKPGNWLWYLLVMVEVPEADYFKRRDITRRAAGIDVGWRARPDGIRVAVVHDGVYSWEFVIPYDLSNKDTQKLQKRLALRNNPVEIVRDWRMIWHDLQQRRDNVKNECKAKLAQINTAEWPEAARAMMSHLDRFGVGALRRLRRILEENGLALSFLDAWYDRDVALAQRIRNAQIRCEQRRDVLYRMFAHWLVTQFDVIGWEDIDLRELARGAKERKEARKAARIAAGESEDGTNSRRRPRSAQDFALDNSEKFRQFASLSTLRGFIRHACHQSQRVLKDAEAAYSTRTCSVDGCGAYVEPSAKLILECEDGHKQDQDQNASVHYWRVAAEDLREVTATGASVDLSQLKPFLRRLS